MEKARNANKSHVGNASGKRGTGSKDRVGKKPNSVTFPADIAADLRLVCWSLYGSDNKEALTKYMTNLALASIEQWQEKQRGNEELALEGETPIMNNATSQEVKKIDPVDVYLDDENVEVK